MILLMPVVASWFSWRKVCNAPYTCAFDSELYSSASSVIVPQGQAPARIPIIHFANSTIIIIIIIVLFICVYMHSERVIMYLQFCGSIEHGLFLCCI